MLRFGLLVAEYQRKPECFPLAGNFMKLVNIIAHWVDRSKLLQWTLLCFIDLRHSIRSVGNYLIRAAKKSGELLGKRVRQDLMKFVSQHKFADENGDSGGSITIQFKGSSNSNHKNSGSNSSSIGGGGGGARKNPVEHPLPAAAPAASPPRPLEVAPAVKEKIEFDLIQFIRELLMGEAQHGLHPHVMAAGLSLLTAVLHQFISSDATVGEAVDYNGALRYLRAVCATENFVDHCMDTAKRQEDNPILIRYSLWTLLIFISQDPLAEAALSANDDSADRIASYLAIHGSIEWAIDVLHHYPNYYSLQVLATVFLIWMEKHGHFRKREYAKLEELRKLLVAANIRPQEAFLPLDEEGEDFYIAGRDVARLGKLSFHTDALIRLVDIHMPAREAADDSESWDGVVHPVALDVKAAEVRDDPHSGKRLVFYTVEVNWDNECSWKVQRNFNLFYALNQNLRRDFAHLPSMPDIEMKKTAFSKIWKVRCGAAIACMDLSSLVFHYLRDASDCVCRRARRRSSSRDAAYCCSSISATSAAPARCCTARTCCTSSTPVRKPRRARCAAPPSTDS